MAFGVNDSGEVVGTYMIGSGNNAKSFGFVWSRAFGFQTINDPHGSGATTLNGINDEGDLVGFYTDAKGNTDGLLVAQGHFRAPFAPPLTTTSPVATTTPTVQPTSTTTPAPVPTGSGSDPLLTPARITTGWPGTSLLPGQPVALCAAGQRLVSRPAWCQG